VLAALLRGVADPAHEQQREPRQDHGRAHVGEDLGRVEQRSGVRITPPAADAHDLPTQRETRRTPTESRGAPIRLGCRRTSRKTFMSRANQAQRWQEVPV